MKENLKFTINNFRIFNKPHTFEFAQITFLTGPNNSGKSSLVKSVLMLKKPKNQNEFLSSVALPNTSLQLSEAREVVNKLDASITYNFHFSHLHHDFIIALNLGQDLPGDPNLYFESLTVISNNKKVLQIANGSLFDLKTIFDFNFWMGYIRNDFIAHKAIRKFGLNSNIEGEQDYISLIKKIPLFELEFEDLLLGKVPEKIQNKFIEIQNKIITEIKEFDESKFDLLLKEFISDFRLKYADLEDVSHSYNIKNLLDDRFDIIFKLMFSYELQKRTNNEIPGNYIIKETELYAFFKEFHKDFLKIIQYEVSKLTDIEVLPVFKVNNARYFQNDDIILSFLSNAIINLDNSAHDDWEKHEDFIKWMNEWLLKFEIGKSIKIININSRNIYTIEIIDLQNNKRNIKDLGFGISQIISLLLSPFNSNFKVNRIETEKKRQLVINKSSHFDKQPIYYLEEPEANLHPNWQSLIMELIIDINKQFGIRFVIESHSEYMVRKLQFMIANNEKKLDMDDVILYYFNLDHNVNDAKGEPKVKKITIDKNGGLSDNFGPGFYDEAINLKFDLLRLNKQQSN